MNSVVSFLGSKDYFTKYEDDIVMQKSSYFKYYYLILIVDGYVESNILAELIWWPLSRILRSFDITVSLESWNMYEGIHRILDVSWLFAFSIKYILSHLLSLHVLSIKVLRSKNSYIKLRIFTFCAFIMLPYLFNNIFL